MVRVAFCRLVVGAVLLLIHIGYRCLRESFLDYLIRPAAVGR